MDYTKRPHILSKLAVRSSMKILVASLCIVMSFAINNMIPPSPIPTDSNNGEGSILSMKPCQFPCWYGVIPGKTTLAEARKILSTLNFFTSAKFSEEYIYPSREGTGEITIIRWVDVDSTHSYASSLSFNDGIVDYISISPHVDFTLGDILKLYGEPQGIKLNYDIGLEQPFVDVTLNAYYPKVGLIVTFQLYSKQGDYYVDSVEIQASAKGQGFSLNTPQSDLQTFIVSIYSNYSNDQANDFYSKHVYPTWPGLGALLISDKANYPIATPVVLTAVPTATITRVPNT